MAVTKKAERLPWIETPCVRSSILSRAAGCNIWLKLDNLQPSGSFKSRGIGNFIAKTAAAATSPVRFYCSSSGNAGLACVTAANAVGLPATIVVHSRSSPVMVAKLKALGATVYVAGNALADADAYLRSELLPNDPSGVYVSPYNHELVWAGAESVVDEVVAQMDVPIDAFVCSVGGGGLLNGMIQGVQRHRNNSYLSVVSETQFVAVETDGADSLNACVREGRYTGLTGITSMAASLGVMQVSKRTWDLFQSENVHSVVVSDAQAALACVRFADDERIMVELACGATLAMAYDGLLEKRVKKDGMPWKDHNVVLEVCGGSGVSWKILEEYYEKYAS
ncbi:serine family amino acid catabolism-related protein [Ceratocystis lukuohia]|uniref:L-serine ammonia-lyase n=1 Tax=Ceratocystis lukuohia TaxID=2019550 RepID=A0ABR4MHV7_9PEZI